MWNTVENLGGTWPATLSLWMIDILTWKECDLTDSINFNVTFNATCHNTTDVRELYLFLVQYLHNLITMLTFRLIRPVHQMLHHHQNPHSIVKLPLTVSISKL